MDGEKDDVGPKEKFPEIQGYPIAAARAEGDLIQPVDGNRQQPKKQANNQMSPPGGLHRGGAARMRVNLVPPLNSPARSCV